MPEAGNWLVLLPRYYCRITLTEINNIGLIPRSLSPGNPPALVGAASSRDTMLTSSDDTTRQVRTENPQRIEVDSELSAI